MDTPKPKGETRRNDNPDAPKIDAVERVVYAIVLTVMAVVPLLAFLFSFGNVGDLGTHLGVDRRIAYLTGPGVDLTATGMIVAATWLSYRGRTERELLRIHVLSVICALMMFGLNCGPAIYTRRFQLAAFNAVGPFLLMAMGFVGPWLLRQLAEARQRQLEHIGREEAVGPGAATAAHTSATAATPAPSEAAKPTAAAAGIGNGRGNKTVTAASADGSRTASVVPIDGNGRRSPEDWAALALPLVKNWIRTHAGERPTAPVVANLLRNAHPDLPVPGSPRSERNIRAAVEDLLDGRAAASETESDDEEPEAALWRVTS